MKNLIEGIKELQNNARIGNIINGKNAANFWDIIEYGRGSYETRYSRMLRWLLDDEENHGLGNKFAEEVFVFCREKSKKLMSVDESKLYDSSKKKENYPLERSSQVEALHENIDIFYNNLNFKKNGTSNETESNLLVMEVKHLSDEHMTIKNGKKMSQLEKYVDAIYKHKTYSFEEYDNKYFVFLTLDGHEAPSIVKDRKDSNLKEWQKLWISMSYQDIVKILGKLLRDETYINMDTMKLIKDFKNDLERQIVSPGDKEILKQVYDDNKEKVIELYDFYFPKKDDEGEQGPEIYEDIYRIEKAINDPRLKEYIRLIYDSVPIQDHTPNDAVRLLMRKIFNYISQGPDLNLNLEIKPKAEERLQKIKSELVEEYELDFDEIYLTSRSGQGIEIHNKSRNGKVYFSGDKDGYVPNPNMSVIEISKKGNGCIVSKNMKNSMFKIDYDLIKEDKININKKEETSEYISFECFMESYFLKEIKVLNDRFNQSEWII